nr:hypothetical protein [uncultured bacterium]
MANTYLDDFSSSASGSVFSSSHFGANIVSHKNDLAAGSPFRSAVDALSPSSLRYPGGTVTEDNFDPRSSFFEKIFENRTDDTVTHSNGDKVATVQSFMNYAAQEGKTVDFVLPTEHLLRVGSNGGRVLDKVAIDKLMSKVDGLLDGRYGDARISVFEIGNEYFVEGRMTAEEYGMIADRMAIELGDAYDRYEARHPSDGNWIQPKIAVQAGAGFLEDDNQTIIDSLSPEARAEIDIVVGHYYPRDLDAVDNYDRFFANLREWEETPGLESTQIWLSEWNIQDSLASDHGIYQASSFIAAFHEMGEEGVDAATVWGVQHRNVDSSLLRLENGPRLENGSRASVTDLTATGYMFQQMGIELRGLRSLDLNQTEFVRTSHRDNIDVQSFGNASRAVIYISSRTDETTTVRLDLDDYFDGNNNISAIRVTTIDDPRTPDIDESAPDSHDAHIAVHGVSYGDLMANGGSVTLQPGEIIQLEVNYGTDGVQLDGYRPLNPVPGDNYNDHFVGSQYSDRLCGYEGDDKLSGAAGRDIVAGGNGNDHLSGGSHNDVVFGGGQNDTLFGGGGHDVLRGDNGNDKIFGGAGNDRMDGGHGEDNLHGGLGNDTLLSLSGSNNLSGEEGGDLFIASVDANTTITDFSYATGDRLSFLGFYDEEDHLQSHAAVVANAETGTSDIIITHETGFTTTLSGAGSQANLLGDANIDMSEPGQSALSLADTLNALIPSQISALMVSFGSEDFANQIMAVDSNVLLSNLDGAQAGAFINGMLPDEATEFYDRISDATFTHFFQGLGPDGLLSFLTQLDADQLNNLTNVIPDNSLDFINETIEVIEDDVSDDTHITPDTNDNPVDYIPEIPVQEDDSMEEPTVEADVSPCFVATAAYCDRLHPDVVSFRLYREQVLRKSAAGLAFIEFYWWVGPKLAAPVNRSKILQNASRFALKCLLRTLQYRHGEKFDRRAELPVS